MDRIGFLLLPLAGGFLLDCLLGDPVYPLHPVRLMGAGIRRLEPWLRARFSATPRGLLQAGAVLAGIWPGVWLAGSAIVLALAAWVGLWLWLAFETLLVYATLATRDLANESMGVYRALCRDDLVGARRALSRVVGRDTAGLDRAGVIRAAVETVAENTTDGVVAPLFYLALGGAPLGLWFKTVSTLDSMVGHRDARYLYFGRVSARLDDAACFLPARLAALAMVAAAFVLGLDAGEAFRIFRRDRKNHQSPNSAQTEAACAGALGIRLGGDCFYGGELCRKPWIGEELREPCPRDILKANRLLYGSSTLCLLLFCLLRAGVFLLIFWGGGWGWG